MASLVIEEKMLYCPKCQQTYEEGSQRFCNNDGGRLLPASGAERSAGKTGGVFTSLLSRNLPNQERDEKLSSIPRFVRPEPGPDIFTSPARPVFESDPDDIELELDASPAIAEVAEPVESTDDFAEMPIFVIDEPAFGRELDDEPQAWVSADPESEEEIVAPAGSDNTSGIEEKLPLDQPMGRTVRADEIPSGRAELGDRHAHPAGREALTWDNTDVLIGQTVKGRYHIIEKVGEDGSGISYLAEDKIVPNKKAVVRIMMDDGEADDFTNKIYAEERISFSHINHPNIVGIIDSGELQEGKPFLITEYVDGESVKDLLEKTGQFNVARTARIIRQASYALSDMHQNGILHRNLKPGNIILSHPVGGTEQVKITGFCIADGATAEGDLAYKAPEVLGGQVATYASDVFSLGVIAYEMLTHRKPFTGLSAKHMLKSQQEGMVLRPTNLRLDVPPGADDILEKAMAPEAVARYSKARDFGDALFNVLTTVAPWTNETVEDIEVVPPAGDEEPQVPMPPAPLFLAGDEEIEPAEAIETTELEVLPEPAAAVDDPAWTKRSPEPPKASGPNWFLLGLLGIALIGGAWALVTFLKRPNQPAYVAQPAPNEQPTPSEPITDGPTQNNLTAVESGEVPPPARRVEPPPGTVFFQNTKQDLKGDLARNFVGFTICYPSDWKVNEAKESSEEGTRGKFLDISHDAPNGKLAEQMLISYYESRGTINADEEKFPQLVAETNETLKKLIPDYQMLSQEKRQINGWWAYEVKFQGGGTTDKGEKLIVWGRRLFIPAARAGVKDGFEITMLATSYSENVKSVDDVGNRPGLSTVLFTFEPGQSF